MDDEYVEAVLGCVDRVPPGRVTTYGAISDAVRERLERGGPRTVGTVMARHGAAVTWWRVVRADGEPSRCHGDEARQAWLKEGTPLRPDGRIDVARAYWQP